MSVRCTCWLVCLFIALPLPPAQGNNVVDFLPPPVERLFKKHRVNKNKIGLLLQRVDGTVLAAHQGGRPFNPASVVKLITALAALDILGAEFRWQTTIAKQGALKNGVLHGDLYLIGGGDPYLTADGFLYLLSMLRSRGIRDIRGELVIDDSVFFLPPHNPAAFDGAGSKPYNVSASGLMVNFKSQRVVFQPTENDVRIYTDPPNDNFAIENRVRISSQRCRNWRGKIRERLSENGRKALLQLQGSYSRRCGEQSFYLSTLEHPAYVAGVFGAMWRRLGGAWSGIWRQGKAPAEAKIVQTQESLPLPLVLAMMNKYSNNVIARNVFLSLAGRNGASAPYTLPAAKKVIDDWLHEKGAPQATIENGSGLSRQARITPIQMTRLLEAAWRHPYRAELISSLSILGQDGTLKKRVRDKKALAGEGHLKTGHLDGITTLSGFFRDKNGDYLMITLFSEQQSSGRIRRLQEDLISWAHGIALE